jgi:hypothetical protein
LLEELQRRGITKFGQDELEYGVTDLIEQAGFIDLAAQLGIMETTVPTASAQDKDHEVPVRVDYIFASPSVAQFATDVHVIKSDLTDAISDHYPVVASFEIEPVVPTNSATISVVAPTPAAPTSEPVLTLKEAPLKPVTPWMPPPEALQPKPVVPTLTTQPPQEPETPADPSELIIQH